MNDTAAAALQYYAPRVYITLAEEVMPSAFLIGKSAFILTVDTAFTQVVSVVRSRSPHSIIGHICGKFNVSLIAKSGSITVLSDSSHRGVKQASTAFMLGSVVVLYASTMAHFGAVIAYSVGHCRLLDAVVASPSSASSTSMALTQFARSAKMSSDIVSAALAVNVGPHFPQSSYSDSYIFKTPR